MKLENGLNNNIFTILDLKMLQDDTGFSFKNIQYMSYTKNINKNLSTKCPLYVSVLFENNNNNRKKIVNITYIQNDKQLRL